MKCRTFQDCNVDIQNEKKKHFHCSVSLCLNIKRHSLKGIMYINTGDDMQVQGLSCHYRIYAIQSFPSITCGSFPVVTFNYIILL